VCRVLSNHTECCWPVEICASPLIVSSDIFGLLMGIDCICKVASPIVLCQKSANSPLGNAVTMTTTAYIIGLNSIAFEWLLGEIFTHYGKFFVFFTFVVTELQIRRRRCYLTWLVRAILAAQQGPTQYIKQMVLMWSISAYSLIYIYIIYIFCVRVFTHPSQLYLKVNKEHLEDFMSFKNAFPLIVKGVKHLCH